MKRLPEKMVMAAIILSCGFFAHSEPSAGDHKAKHPTAENPPKRLEPSANAGAMTRPSRLAKSFVSRVTAP